MRQSPAPLSLVPAATAATGLAVVTAAFLRTHSLLAGSEPAPAPFVAAAVFVALALGTAVRASSSGRARAFGVLAAVAAVLLALGARDLLSGRWGWQALALSMVATAVPAFLAGVAGLAAPRRGPAGRGLARLLAGGGLGLLASGLVLLPLIGPSVAGLLGAALLLAVVPPALRSEPAAAGDTPAAEAAPPGAGPWLVPLLSGACSALLAAAATWSIVTIRPQPWPLGLATLGVILVAAALAAAPAGWLDFGSRTHRALLLVAGTLTLVAALPGVHALSERLLARLVGNLVLPAVGLPGGPLVLAFTAILAGLFPGLLVGVSVGRSRSRAPALLGAGLGAALAAWAVVGLGSHLLLLAVGAAGVLVLHVAFAQRPGAGPQSGAARPLQGLLAVLAVLPVIVMAGMARPGVTPGSHVLLALSPPGARLVVEETGAGPGEMRRVAWFDARRVQDDAAWLLSSDLLAGHLAALIPPLTKDVLVIGAGSGRTLEALAAFAVPRVRVVEPSRALASAAAGVLPANQTATLAPCPTALGAQPESLDAIILQLADPAEPAFTPFFTPEARAAYRRLLRPGGVLIVRLDASRLGPEGVLREVRALSATFPGVRLASADLGRSGVLLALAMVGDDERALATGPPLPFDRLVLDSTTNPRITEAARTSLHRGLCFTADDLFHTFIAGERELTAVGGTAGPSDAWAEGDRAVRHAAPEPIARELTRGLLFSGIQTVDLDLSVQPHEAQAPWTASWPLVGLETDLPQAWNSHEGRLRILNTPARFRNVPGTARESSRRLVLAREAGRLTVTEEQRTQASAATLSASIRSFWSDDVKRSGHAIIHGHPAAWLFLEPSADEQVLHVTWHCPYQGRLYAAELRINDGRPGMHEELLETLIRQVRCSHLPG